MAKKAPKTEFEIGMKTSEFNSKVKEMGNSMKQLKDEMRIASNEFISNGKNVESLQKHYEAINKAVEQSRDKIKLFEDQISKTNEKLTANKEKLQEISEQKLKANKAYEEAVKVYGKESEEAEKAKESLDKLNKQYTEQENKVKNNEKSIANYNSKLSSSKVELSELEAKLKTCSDEIEVQSNKFLESSKRFEESGAKFKAAGGKLSDMGEDLMKVSGALIGAGAAIGMLNSNFESGLAKVNTLVGKTSDELGKFGEEMVKSSNDSNIALGDYTDAVYDAVSAGISFNDSLKFIEESNKVAVGGFATLGDSANVLTQIMNIYGKSVDDVSDISDKLFLVQQEGVVTVGQLSTNMAESATSARAYNVNLENLLSAYASLTKQGRTASTAQTQLKALFDELGDSGSKVGKVLEEETSKSFSTLMSEGKSLTDVLKIVKDSTDGNQDAFNGLWSSSEAMGAGLSLLNDEGKFFVDTLDKMGDSSGLTQKAFDTMANTTDYKLKKALNELKNSFVELGKGATPMIEAVSGAISNLANYISTLDPKVVESGMKMAGYGLAIGGLTKIIGGTVTGIGSFLEAVSSISKVLSSTVKTVDTASDSFDTISKVAKTTSGSVEGMSGSFNALEVVGSALFSPTGLIVGSIALVAGLGIAFNESQKELDKSTEKFKEIGSTLEDFDGRIRTSGSVIDEVFGKEINIKFSDEVKTARTTIETETDAIIERVSKFYDDLKEIQMNSGMTPEEKESQTKALYEAEYKAIEQGFKNQRQLAWDNRSNSLSDFEDYLNSRSNLSEKQVSDEMAEFGNFLNAKQEELRDSQTAIEDIYKTAYEQNRTLTEEENAKIEELQAKHDSNLAILISGSLDDRINAYSLYKEEQKLIMKDAFDSENASFDQYLQASKNFNLRYIDDLNERKEKAKKIYGENSELYKQEEKWLSGLGKATNEYTDIYKNSMQKNIDAGQSASTASKNAFMQIIKDLESGKLNAEKFGLTTEEAMALVSQKFMETTDDTGVLKQALDKLPAEKRLDVLAKVSGTDNIDYLKNKLDNIYSKDINVRFNYSETGTATLSKFNQLKGNDYNMYPYATGGTMPEDGLMLTNEKGWELIDTPNNVPINAISTLAGDISYAPEGTKVYNNLQSTEMMKAEIKRTVDRAMYDIDVGSKDKQDKVINLKMGDLVVQGNVVEDTLPMIQSMLDKKEKDIYKNINNALKR